MDKYDRMSTRDLRQLLTLQGVDASQCLEKKDLVQTALLLENTNFDDAGRALLAKLNLQRTPRTKWNKLDAIWRHPETGATVYVGNILQFHSRHHLRYLKAFNQLSTT